MEMNSEVVSLRERLIVHLYSFNVTVLDTWGVNYPHSPISVPTPSTLPPKLIRADSPPEDPPEVRFLCFGFTVRPNVLFTDSAIIIAADTRSACLLL
jgi:hypothetical protein